MARKAKNVSKWLSLPWRVIVPCFFFGGVAAVYLHNLTRDIYSGDIGDLVTASAVHGVAHPPGYPLFSLLGFLFSLLPFPLPIVSRVGLVSVTAALASLVLFYQFSRRITHEIFLSLLSTAILAFSYLFWFHAEIPEAFGLNNFLAIAILSTAFLFYQERKDQQLYLTAFLCGLGMTHHQTIIFIFPAVLFLVLKHAKYVFLHPKRIIFSVLALAAGLLPYLYVPLAASSNPPINWDNATTLHNFIHLLLRKDYGIAPAVFNEIPISVKLLNVQNFLQALLQNYSYQGMLLILMGAIYLIKQHRLLFAGLVTAFLIAGPLYMFYGAIATGIPAGIGIIERFYVLPSVILAFFIPFGLFFLFSLLKPRFSRSVYAYVIVGYFLIVPLLMLRYNFAKTDLSQTQIGNTLADNIYSYLPQNAVLFVSGDTTTFNIWYNSYVLGKRPDVGLINPPGVGGNKYFDAAINRYRADHPHEPLKDLPLLTIADLQTTKRMFATYQLPFLPPKTVLLPEGIVYEIVKRDALPDERTYVAQVEPYLHRLRIVRKETLAPAEDNLVAEEIPTIYASGLVRIADFIYTQYHDPALAEHYYRRALWIDPDHSNAYAGLALSLFTAYHDCQAAPENMKQAITLYPVWKTYYIQLYVIYQRCGAKATVLRGIADEYQQLFHEDIRKSLSQKNLK